MKKIAILSCMDSAIKCSSADCLNFFENRVRSFDIYAKGDASVGAVIVCDCCKNVDNMKECISSKIDRLKKYEITDIHVSDCVTKEAKNCGYAKEFIKELKENGFHIFFIRPNSLTQTL